VISDPKVGNFFFWFFFVVTIAWTVVAIIVRAFKIFRRK